MAGTEVLDVSRWPVDIQEASGSSENLWLEDGVGETWLFKPNRVQSNGHEQGEDWAELLAHRIAHLLEIPTAVARMGVRRDVEGRERRGALSANVVSTTHRLAGYEMQTGGVLLSGDPHFRTRRSDGSGRPVRDHVGHTVPAVLRCLDGVGPPTSSRSPFDARGTFAGYLVLDALIGNQDRHEQNWGVVVAPDGMVTLAPSYDHGASLGFGMQDERRAAILDDDHRVARYAAGGTGKKFQGRSTPLLDLALEALDIAGPEVARGWLSRVGDCGPAALDAAVQAVPRMSDLARTFCVELLLNNRRRLLDVAR